MTDKICYDNYDRNYKDITEKVLENIGQKFGVENLSPARFGNSNPFPVNGIVHGPNRRVMVPLICQSARNPDTEAKFVWFVIDTVSPFTCLTKKTMEALLGPGNVTKPLNRFVIQDPNIEIECQISKGNFEFANVLGVDSLKNFEASIGFDWKTKTCKLWKS